MFAGGDDALTIGVFGASPRAYGLEWMPTTLREVADEVGALKRRAAN